MYNLTVNPLNKNCYREIHSQRLTKIIIKSNVQYLKPRLKQNTWQKKQGTKQSKALKFHVFWGRAIQLLQSQNLVWHVTNLCSYCKIIVCKLIIQPK